MQLKAQVIQPCPSSPNCVSSYEATESNRSNPRYIEPFTYPVEIESQKAFKILKQVLSEEGFSIVSSDYPILKSEAYSKIFKFVDKMMFVFDEAKHQVEIRSESQTGYYDFGKNRQRMNAIRKSFHKQLQ